MTQNNFPMIDLCATGKRIKEVREQKGITVKALQAFLGFNEPVSIYKWQRANAFLHLTICMQWPASSG